jgi:cytoskeletal protein CcmA (bactofilin family)
MPSVLSDIRRVPLRLSAEGGIALPTALMMLFVIGLISTAAVLAATSGNDQSVRDRGVKRALAAVDAGLQAATYRTNKVTNAADKCVTKGTDGSLEITDALSDGWCAPQSESLGDGAYYTYRVSLAATTVQNGQTLYQRDIVATGCVHGPGSPAGCVSGAQIKRRAESTVGAVSAHLFGAGGVLSKDTVTVGNNGYIGATVASNDDVVIQNNGEICGNVRYGPSAGDDFSQANNATYDCPGTSAVKAQQEFLLNPVDGSAARASNNNNLIGSQDTVTGTVYWDATNRTLRLDGSSSLTLTGDLYSFCYLEVGNGAELRVASRAAGRPPLRVFMDRPENCTAAGPDRGSVKVENSGKIINQTSDPTMLQLYVEGSTTQATNVYFRNNSQTGANMSLVVYAPNSYVEVNNNGYFYGAIAAKQILVENNASLIWDPRMESVSMDTQLLFQRQHWGECSVDAPGPAPDSGC